jgi:hypothetical protein
MKKFLLLICSLSLLIDKTDDAAVILGGAGANRFVVSGGGGTTLVASDAFTRTASNLGANWTQQDSDIGTDGTQLDDSGNNQDNLAFWSGAGSFGNDMYAKATVKQVASGNTYVGVTARASGSGATMTAYYFVTDGASGSGHTEIGKWVNNVQTVLKAVATTFSTSDTIEIRVTGSSPATIKAFKNGTQVDSTTDTTAALASGGKPGVYVFMLSPTNARLDDWEGGTVP